MKDNRFIKFTRSSEDRILFGVCGGLGSYFKVDSLLFRVAFVIITLAGGLSILLYILLTIFTPVDNN